MESLAQLGVVTGKGEVRDAQGNLKCTFELRGTTPLTEDELRQRLSMPPRSDNSDEVK